MIKMVVEEIPILKDIIADNQILIDDMTNKLSAIKAEIITYHRRDNKESTAWLTIELIEKALDGSYFTNKGEDDGEVQ